MAQRRMFSLKIIDSARFLKMPASTRLLYFDLCMRADDDGVVEGFNVLRMTGATEDDLKVLVAKDFIKVLNEDLVSYVTDWKEHNKIRADRKVDSIYKDLLLKVLPDVKLLEPKQRADLKKKKTNDCTSYENNWTSSGQTKDGLGEDRLGKDRLDEDRTVEESMSVVVSNTEVFKYFEQCGFLLSAIQMDLIAADIEVYSAKWLMDAAEQSVRAGKINYNYVQGILRNWKAEGRREDKDGSTKQNTGKNENKKYNIDTSWNEEEWRRQHPVDPNSEDPI